MTSEIRERRQGLTPAEGGLSPRALEWDKMGHMGHDCDALLHPSRMAVPAGWLLNVTSAISALRSTLRNRQRWVTAVLVLVMLAYLTWRGLNPVHGAHPVTVIGGTGQ